jgi:CubicO group peptidase (beta-lactamase class C family)
MRWIAVTVAILAGSATARGSDLAALDQALQKLANEDRFSGAVVIRDADGVRFSRGYGLADPFTGRSFTPDTPVDSASLAKPVTAAVVLQLAQAGKLDLDAPVRRYLADYPHESATVRHLLAHSAGLPLEDKAAPLANKTNEMVMNAIADQKLPPNFAPGTAFEYCNTCYMTLALLTERVTGTPHLTLAHDLAALPKSVGIRPLRLAQWRGRAIGYRRTSDGRFERADSYESEAFYGANNLSINATQLAQWGSEWWQSRLAKIRMIATTPAQIAGIPSGLTWGNWYCAPDRQRCHYLGHHEGFHHMLFWDGARRLSIAMVSNNTLDPALHQRLQRAIVAFASGDASAGKRELASPLSNARVHAGHYASETGAVMVVARDDTRLWIERGGLRYRAFRMGADTDIRYVPGLDAYLTGSDHSRLLFLSLYEDLDAAPSPLGNP